MKAPRGTIFRCSPWDNTRTPERSSRNRFNSQLFTAETLITYRLTSKDKNSLCSVYKHFWLEGGVPKWRILGIPSKILQDFQGVWAQSSGMTVCPRNHCCLFLHRFSLFLCESLMAWWLLLPSFSSHGVSRVCLGGNTNLLWSPLRIGEKQEPTRLKLDYIFNDAFVCLCTTKDQMSPQ